MTNTDPWKYGSGHTGFDEGMSDVLIGKTGKARPGKGMTPWTPSEVDKGDAEDVGLQHRLRGFNYGSVLISSQSEYWKSEMMCQQMTPRSQGLSPLAIFSLSLCEFLLLSQV